jgi:hypothetical protein
MKMMIFMESIIAMTMMMMDIEIWFDDLVEDEDLEYPLLPCVDSIWTP